MFFLVVLNTTIILLITQNKEGKEDVSDTFLNDLDSGTIDAPSK